MLLLKFDVFVNLNSRQGIKRLIAFEPKNARLSGLFHRNINARDRERC